MPKKKKFDAGYTNYGDELDEIEPVAYPVEVTDSAVHVPVRVLRRQGESVVVQYLEGDDVRAVVLPAKVVRTSSSASNEPYALGSDILAGVGYGVDWDATLTISPNVVERIAKGLRAANIWTVADARLNPNVVIGVLQQAYGLDLGTILSIPDPVVLDS